MKTKTTKVGKLEQHLRSRLVKPKLKKLRLLNDYILTGQVISESFDGKNVCEQWVLFTSLLKSYCKKVKRKRKLESVVLCFSPEEYEKRLRSIAAHP